LLIAATAIVAGACGSGSGAASPPPPSPSQASASPTPDPQCLSAAQSIAQINHSLTATMNSSAKRSRAMKNNPTGIEALNVSTASKIAVLQAKLKALPQLEALAAIQPAIASAAAKLETASKDYSKAYVPANPALYNKAGTLVAAAQQQQISVANELAANPCSA
jgi:hypothetical protein